MKKIMLVIASVFLWSFQANAAILWTQMNYLINDYGPQSSAIYGETYDDFWFNTDARIEEISWAGLANTYPNDNAPITTPFTVEIWSSAVRHEGELRMPGEKLVQYTFEFELNSPDVMNLEDDPNITWDTSSGSYYRRFRYNAVLDTPFVAQAHTYYWITVYNNPEFYWQMVRDNLADPENRRPQMPDNNAGSSHDVAFELRGATVPIPGGIWLLGSGLFCFLGLRKKRQ